MDYCGGQLSAKSQRLREHKPMPTNNILIFGGSGGPKLTRKICGYLNVTPGRGEVIRFSEGNLFVRIQENVRGCRVYHRESISVLFF